LEYFHENFLEDENLRQFLCLMLENFIFLWTFVVLESEAYNWELLVFWK